MTTEVAERDECPKCGVDREKLREMMKEPKGSDNWELARKIILNCPSCLTAFAYKIDKEAAK